MSYIVMSYIVYFASPTFYFAWIYGSLFMQEQSSQLIRCLDGTSNLPKFTKRDVACVADNGTKNNNSS